MKGYISVYDDRSLYLKDIFKQNGYEIKDYQDGLDFYFINKENKPECDFVFTLNDQKGNYVINKDDKFRHLNNTLTVASFFIAVQNKDFFHKKILILGYGDLAKQLAKALCTYNEITIANRNYKDEDEIKKYYRHIDIHLMTGSYDYVINTVPNADIDYGDLKYECIYDLANTLSLKNYVSLRNLPNLYFPYESAMLMYDYIVQVINHA